MFPTRTSEPHKRSMPRHGCEGNDLPIDPQKNLFLMVLWWFMVVFNGILWDLMGFNGILWDLMGLYPLIYPFLWFLMGFYGIPMVNQTWSPKLCKTTRWIPKILWDLMGFNGIYPLVNIEKTIWKNPPLKQLVNPLFLWTIFHSKHEHTMSGTEATILRIDFFLARFGRSFFVTTWSRKGLA